MSRDTLSPDLMQLGAAILVNLPQADIPQQALEHYLRHKDQIAPALSRGFVIPGSSGNQTVPAAVEPAVPTPFEFPRRFKAKDTNLDEIIPVTEHFAKKILGVKVNLREQFDFPAELPWKDVLLVFDPGINNREAVEKSLQGQKLKVYEESNVMEYSRSEASDRSMLQIIENSIRPTEDTMGKTPNQLNADGRPYLELRGYALVFGLKYFASKDYLDPQTWTWFPKNRLPGGGVAGGGWAPNLDFRGVWFHWRGPGSSGPRIGARLAMSVKLKT